MIILILGIASYFTGYFTYFLCFVLGILFNPFCLLGKEYFRFRHLKINEKMSFIEYLEEKTKNEAIKLKEMMNDTIKE